MRSAFFGFHVATTGLQTARAALNVTSHNIANAEIPGYSRQVAQMSAARPLYLGDSKGMYGTGSQVNSIIQIRDKFLDRKYWTQTAVHGQYTSVNTYLNFVETVFNQIPNVGVMRTFSNFYSTLQDLTTRAHESTFRTNVTTTGYSLAEQVRQNALSLQSQQQDLNREFADVVVTINSLGSQIAALNEQIHLFERDGSHANDLRDQRALLIDRLSSLVNVQVEERDYSRPGMANDKRLSIMINGYDFIDHTRFSRLELVARDDPHNYLSGTRRNEMDIAGLYDIFFSGTGVKFDIYSPTLTGKLKGIIDVRDGNGGQITADATLTGQLLIAEQLAALQRTADYLNGLTGQLATLQTNLPTWVTARTTTLAALGGSSDTAGAQAYINGLTTARTTWSNFNATIPALRSQIITAVGFPSLRSAVETAVTTALGGTGSDAATNTILNNIQTLLNDITAGTITPATFATNLNTELTALSARLTTVGVPAANAVFTRIASVQTNLTASPPLTQALEDRLNDMANVFTTLGIAGVTNITTLDAAITAANTNMANLTNALNQINQILTLAERIEVQLEWAIGIAQETEHLANERANRIEAGLEAGDATFYRTYITALQTEIANMQAVAAGLTTPTTPLTVYSPLADLEAFRAGELTDAIGGFGTDFADSIANIQTAAGALPVGQSVTHGTTTTFKGIPFYMNQLNHLVRTFARAMNEGKNLDGDPIAGTVGHIYGYNANGENTNAMFFTFKDSVTGAPGVVVDPNDPFNSLRMWILADAAGNPQRDANGNLVTVSDPNPPANVARDSTGNPMYTLDYSQFNALNFIVNPDIISDPRLLAASGNANIGQANNDVIHGFLSIFIDNSLFREGSLMDFIIATSNHLAVDNNQALMFRESYEEVTMQTHNQRLSVSSVDTEEEMLNLVRFQNLFIASSKLLNVIDTIYDTLINKLGNF
ncbi:MAG: flagellar hook-associated protein FlgK [Clostridiales bacterium]|jgi:flagellar hook-associated protein FlgK|nr:flagellar hook-associated protein FlgK [Clostridiales bacterium]